MSYQHQPPQPPQPPARQSYRFGPIALLARYRRWHTTAPIWQILLITIVQLVLIVLAWSDVFKVLRR